MMDAYSHKQSFAARSTTFLSILATLVMTVVDFWARGDGWVLAGLAKVLQDMPRDYKHHQFFVDKYVQIACQGA